MATRAYFDAVDDMLVRSRKPDHLRLPRRNVQELKRSYTSGLVTQGERYNKSGRYLGSCR